MMTALLPLAHAGHWLTSLAYFLPVLIFLGWLGFITVRDRRKRRREGGG